jgi:hypothetical protein
MRKMFVASLAAIAVAGLTAGTVHAQCWFDGYTTACAPVAPYYVEPPYFYPTPYAAWNAWDFRDYRLQPNWLPTYPGPRPGK